jgi:hypothetical protein
MSNKKQLKNLGKGKRKRKAEPITLDDFQKLKESNQIGSGKMSYAVFVALFKRLTLNQA